MEVIMKYVLPDTNILINSPQVIKDLVSKKLYVVIPVTVINELDNLKIRKDLSYKAREIGRIIEELVNQRSKYLLLTNDHKEVHGLTLKKADDRILAAALYLKDQGKDVVLLSNDRFFRLKAEGLELKIVISPDKIKAEPEALIAFKTVGSGTHRTPQENKPSITATPNAKPEVEKIPAKPIETEKYVTDFPVGNDAYLIITSPTHLYQNRKIEFAVEGFDDKYLNRIKFIKPGDRFVYYVSGDKLFAAITEITSKVFYDKTDLWPMEPDLKLFNRLKMAPKVVLNPQQILSAYSVIPKLRFVQNKSSWGAYFQGSIKKISREDYLLIEQAMKKIIANWLKDPHFQKCKNVTIILKC
jgi:predicted RNA-binding protein/rRNA-processing protein FCF1